MCLCIASRDRWIFPRFLCHRLFSPPLHSSFYTDPSSGSYFVSNSSGWLFFVVKKEKKREKGKKRRRGEEKEKEKEIVTASRANRAEELEYSRIFFASVTRRPRPGPSNQSTGPQSNSRRFTEIMDGRKQLDPRQRTPNKYRSDEIEDTRRNRDEEEGRRGFHGPVARREKIIPSPGTSFCLRLFFLLFSSLPLSLVPSRHKARFVLKGTTHN